MNQKQREMTVGHLLDCLEAMAQEKAGTLTDADEMARQARWTHIQGLLGARDKVKWAVVQVGKWQFEKEL